MKEYKQIGEEITKGIVSHLLTLVVIFWVVFAAMDYFEWCDLDPTDASCRQKSGLHYYKDHGTGKEYLSTGKGGPLLERIK